MAGEKRFTLAVDHDRGLVTVTYRGTITLDDRIEAVEAASRELEETGYRRVLVDLSRAEMASQAPEAESRFAHVLSNNRVLARCRTAYLARERQAGNWFIELLAKTRHYPFGHFTDLDRAYEWLMEA